MSGSKRICFCSCFRDLNFLLPPFSSSSRFQCTHQQQLEEWRPGSNIWQGVDTVSGKRRFLCGFCRNYTSLNSHNVVVHTRWHTGERPFSCPACNKAYVQKQTLLVHVKNCHPDVFPLMTGPARL
ncbi:unnamed protein product [Notodromas monacha]|uniref:C2H2-type domain-containing protein n=1 Tax=Notodromas monacha TaxID=399045 RepID=A0A7R9BQG7_9CRUS|nr:unnamed protein product [Notodromas monacha]CAG0918931.1 unnamed protein product [Notodromas monacha]